MDIQSKLKTLPSKPGVYIMLSREDEIIYVGKAISLKNRVRQYFQYTEKPIKVQAMVANVADFRYIITNNEIDALILESNLIKKHKPKYNILLKDDKNYPFIKIDLAQDFPMLEIVRRLTPDKAFYFGPYMQGISANALVDIVNSAFGLRTCLNPLRQKRACLKSHLGICTAPCVGSITREKYLNIVEEAIEFLKGRDDTVKAILTERMIESSEKEDYETALKMRDMLKSLDKIVRNQITAVPKRLNTDCFAMFSDGVYSCISLISFRNGRMLGMSNVDVSDMPSEDVVTEYITQYYYDERLLPDNIIVAEPSETLEGFFLEKFGKRVRVNLPRTGHVKKIFDMAYKNAEYHVDKILSEEQGRKLKAVNSLTQLQKSLKMDTLRRMECYDISNISGTDKVASMVVFEDGERKSSHYRRFRIKTVEGSDDFASMAEVLSRRSERFTDTDESFSSIPELIVIDGGKGQLSHAYEALSPEYRDRIKLIGLAKREEEVFEVGRSEPIILPRGSLQLKLLQRIRDEAHRFAITYHRKLRKDRQTRSILKQIDGIGDAKIKHLYSKLGSFKAISTATRDELVAIKGISGRDADNIISFFERRTHDEV